MSVVVAILFLINFVRVLGGEVVLRVGDPRDVLVPNHHVVLLLPVGRQELLVHLEVLVAHFLLLIIRVTAVAMRLMLVNLRLVLEVLHQLLLQILFFFFLIVLLILDVVLIFSLLVIFASVGVVAVGDVGVKLAAVVRVAAAALAAGALVAPANPPVVVLHQHQGLVVLKLDVLVVHHFIFIVHHQLGAAFLL
jgi:hypothetical protein